MPSRTLLADRGLTPLQSVPTPRETEQLATRLRKAVAEGGIGASFGPLNVQRVSELLGADIECRRLRSAQGGLQALLIPEGERFRVVVDAEPPGGWASVDGAIRGELERHRFRFRVLHELAHTLFYERQHGRLRRIVPDSPEQEQFCDAFARTALVPPDAARVGQPTAATAAELQRRFDVSMEVAVRALAAAHPNAAVWLIVLGSDRPSLQWRSPASYHVGVKASEVARAVRSCPDNTTRTCPRSQLTVARFADRRQAFVAATF